MFFVQMTEETHNAAMAGSIGIVTAIGVSFFLGWFLLLGLLFSIQDLDRTVNSATGEPVAQILLDTVGTKGASVLMVREFPVSSTGVYFCPCGGMLTVLAVLDGDSDALTRLTLCRLLSSGPCSSAERSL